MKRLAGVYGLNGLVPMVLPHGAAWAIEEGAARQLMLALAATDVPTHMAEFAARRGEAEASDDRPYEMSGGVAYIGIAGPMTKARTSFESGSSTVQTRRLVRTATADPAVKGVVLVIDSPGGSVSGTDDLARDVAELSRRKPTCAYVEDMCCSAAYWVASQCGAIFANPTALVGSIGTYAVVHDLSRAAESDGVKVHVVSTGPHKGAGVPGTEVDDAYLAEVRRTVEALNACFLASVGSGRGMDPARVAELADGRVHIAADAQALGLIDGVCSIDDAALRLSSGAYRRAARAISTVSEGEAEPPAGSTLAQQSETALAAVRDLETRLRAIHATRQSDGRALSVGARSRCNDAAEALDGLATDLRRLAGDDGGRASMDALGRELLEAEVALAELTR